MLHYKDFIVCTSHYHSSYLCYQYYILRYYMNMALIPLGVAVVTDNIPFIPYYGIKDVFSIALILIVFLYFIYYAPDALGHSDNYIEANFLVTPAHDTFYHYTLY